MNDSCSWAGVAVGDDAATADTTPFDVSTADFFASGDPMPFVCEFGRFVALLGVVVVVVGTVDGDFEAFGVATVGAVVDVGDGAGGSTVVTAGSALIFFLSSLFPSDVGVDGPLVVVVIVGVVVVGGDIDDLAASFEH